MGKHHGPPAGRQAALARRITGVLAALSAAGGCSNASDVPAWCRSDEPSARLILVGEAPSRALTLQELWRAGEGDGSHFFASPRRPAVSPGGRVAVPDPQAKTVLVVDPDGSWRGPVVRSGPGPGEVQWPVDVEWVGEEQLLVFDLARGRVLRIGLNEDTPPEEWAVDAALMAEIYASGSLNDADLSGSGDLLLELPWEAEAGEPGTRRAVVARASRDGALDTLQTQNVAVLSDGPFTGWAVPGSPRPAFTASTAGILALAGAVPQYRVAILDGSLRDSVVFCRDVPPLPYTKEERGEGSSEDGPEALLTGLQGASRPAFGQALGRIFLGEWGRLWIQRDRLDPLSGFLPVEGGRYEVIEADGSLAGSVQAPARVVLFGEAAGRVYGMLRGPYDEMYLVAYALRSLQ